ncbi:MAG: hypothetical protein WC492_02150 [Candidatus Micrarchaeia archaeon]
MAGKSIMDYTWEIYTKNIWLILVASVPGLFGMILPIIVGMINPADPVYIALGGAYLRTGSIVDLTPVDSGIMIASLLISLYLMSFAIVGINLVVKRQRTLKGLTLEEIKAITKHTNSVFMIFLIATILLLLIQLITYEYQIQKYLAPLLNLIVGLGLLFLPTAMVMDEVRPFRAMQRSFSIIRKKPSLVLLWMVVALMLLSIVDVIVLFVVNSVPFIPHVIGPLIVIAFNSLIILPYLIVMLAQIYISKYTILVD